MTKEKIHNIFEKYRQQAITTQYSNKESGTTTTCKVITLYVLKMLELELINLQEKENKL